MRKSCALRGCAATWARSRVLAGSSSMSDSRWTTISGSSRGRLQMPSTTTINIPAHPILTSFAKAAELFDAYCASLGYKMVNMRPTSNQDVYVVMGRRDNPDVPEDRQYATWAGGVDFHDEPT